MSSIINEVGFKGNSHNGQNLEPESGTCKKEGHLKSRTRNSGPNWLWVRRKKDAKKEDGKQLQKIKTVSGRWGSGCRVNCREANL